MKVALVYDRLNKQGGAERVLSAFSELYQDADWYTSVWEPKLLPASQTWKVYSSYISKLPWLRTKHEWFPYLMPFIFESFNFSGYDLVISIGSAECKGIITKPSTIHLNYCLTPTRYLWSHKNEYLSTLPKLIRGFSLTIVTLMQKWDLVAATRPDHMISISNHVKNRVKKYYHRPTSVIYPPVDVASFTPSAKKDDYYLIVSRLVAYKNIELAIQTFNANGQKLVIVGTGTSQEKLKKIANENISFLGQVGEAKLHELYKHARAFVQCNEEDFGIAMVESLASGTPVLALARGGALEIVTPTTGVLYNESSVSSLQNALNVLANKKISPHTCRRQAEKFDKKLWQKKIVERIEKIWLQNQT